MSEWTVEQRLRNVLERNLDMDIDEGGHLAMIDRSLIEEAAEEIERLRAIIDASKDRVQKAYLQSQR